jgi:hypothetical protein
VNSACAARIPAVTPATTRATAAERAAFVSPVATASKAPPTPSTNVAMNARANDRPIFFQNSGVKIVLSSLQVFDCYGDNDVADDDKNSQRT